MERTAIENLIDPNVLMSYLVEQGARLGWIVIKALLVVLIGRFVIGFVNRMVIKLLSKREIDPSVKTFAGSLVKITLTVLLIISVVGVLGVQTTSFAALLASVGVAVGMALSGNLSNFAGGLIILLFKPYRVGDYIETQGTGGTVAEIQIFHTVLTTSEGKMVYIPNGSASSSLVTNYNVPVRRIEWVFGVDYGADYDRVKALAESILMADNRILSRPHPMVALQSLSESSVDIVMRGWVASADYWEVYFAINKAVYQTFNENGIGFPFPQVIVHKR